MTPEELEDCRAVLRRFQRGQISGDDVEYVEMMLSYIDQLGAQITALKEIAIEERAIVLWYREIASNLLSDISEEKKKEYLHDARQQLEEEHPEAMRS